MLIISRKQDHKTVLNSFQVDPDSVYSHILPFKAYSRCPRKKCELVGKLYSVINEAFISLPFWVARRILRNKSFNEHFQQSSCYSHLIFSFSRNNVDDITQVEFLALCTKLVSLTLTGNPVELSPHPDTKEKVCA